MLGLVLLALAVACAGAEQQCEGSQLSASWWLDDELGDFGELQQLSPRPLLPEADTAQRCADATLGGASDRMHVLKAVAERAAHHGSVFVMLNGQSVGRWVPFVAGCAYSLGQAAAVALEVKEDERARPMMLYTPSGRPVSELTESTWILHLLLEQEVWVWPGVELGFSWRLGNMTLTTVHLVSPRVILINNFLTGSECDTMVELARDNMFRSPTKDYVTDGSMKDFRTSTTNNPAGPLPNLLRARVWLTQRLPQLSYAETVQVVRYESAQWFKPHHDFFHTKLTIPDSHSVVSQYDEWVQWALQQDVPEEYRVQEERQLEYQVVDLFLKDGHPGETSDWAAWLLENRSQQRHNLLRSYLKTRGHNFPTLRQSWETRTGRVWSPSKLSNKWVEPNRHVTIFGYLNDCEMGGQTIFPDAKNWRRDNTSATPELYYLPTFPECGAPGHGLAVKPVKGSAAMFYSKTPTMQRDYSSLHGGCPLPQGHTKWGMNGFSWSVPQHVGQKAHEV